MFRIQSVFRFVVVLFVALSASAATFVPTGRSVPGEVLVKIREGVSPDAIKNLQQLAGIDRGERLSNLQSGALWRMHSGSRDVAALTEALQNNPNVEYVEPNYIVHLEVTPNDPSYGLLWGLENTGQSINSVFGFGGSDIDAKAAWNLSTGSASVVVGVVDTGIDYTHPDLAANVWSNPGGKGNAGCAAGTHGFNAITKTCNPMDDHYHGTHVSGTIGAVGNNSLGVAGVNWTASIMGLKFIDSSGNGTAANAIEAIDFAVQAKIDGVNVRVLSNSWGGFGFSKAMLDEINKANEHDILFVTSAGNDSLNNDSYPHYPSSYATPNMIAVAATDNRDAMAYFSNYGLKSVHLGAPGVNVYSCFPDASYGYLSGTSMAAPHVAGVAALILAHSPNLTTAEVKSAILDHTDPIPSLAGITVTGGRLNVAKALGAPSEPDFTLSITPAYQTVIQGGVTTYTVTVTPVSGFSGSVNLTLAGTPTDATATFTPASTTTTSTLTIATTNTTPIYNHFLTITGTSGALTRAVPATLIVSSTPTLPACPGFAMRVNYSAFTPTAVAIADLNRDGRSDVVNANLGSNSVSIRLGTGNGALQLFANALTGTAPIALAVADFNRDGKPDLAVANSGSNNISVLMGNGDGTFQTAAPYGVGASPFALAAGDFNGDGVNDLAVANNGSGDVSILIGQADGTFAAPVSYDVASGAFAVAIGDLDGDGRNDLVVAGYNEDKISVLMGNGDGTFAAAVQHAVGDKPSSVAIGDLNGDGKLDLAVTNYGDDNASVMIGAGDGTFMAPVSYPTGIGPYSVVIGDWNGDGQRDLAVANGDSATVSLLMNAGNALYLPAIQHTVGTDASQVTAGDLDGDGRMDLAVANAGSNSLSILINNGICSASCNTIAAASLMPVSGAPHSLTAGDFDGDGNLDVAAATRGTNTAALVMGNGDGTFDTGAIVGVGTNPDSITAGDFNRDGSLDLAIANSGGGNASVLIGNGDGTFQPAANYGAGTTPRSVMAGDFNRDGKLDLAIANSGSNNISILIGNGDGTFQAAVPFGAGTSPFGVTAGDFNRDGKLDLAVANSGSNNVSILIGNGDGTFQAATNFNAGTSPRTVAVADFNRDGKLDLAVANGGSANVSVLLGVGNGTFQTAIDYGAGSSPASITAVDLNDDGKLDLAVANNASANVSVLVGNGAGAFAPAVHSSAGSGPAGIVAGDFNHDGKPDLAVASSASGSVALLRNTCPSPDLTITKTHSATFTQGSSGKTYTITATNSGLVATSGLVTVADTLPTGLSVTGMSGTGWTCMLPTVTCTRLDSLAAGASFPPITLTVNVGSGTAATVTNTVTVAGGGELNTANDAASDPTTVVQIRDLMVTASHSGSFTQSATGKKYTLIVRNGGGQPTTGTVTVVDTLPAGLTATAISGTGWSCTLGSLTCTRSDVLAGGGNYPAILVTVNVAANAAALVTNTVTVSGGGDQNAANNIAIDPTVVWSSQTCGAFGVPTYYDTDSNPFAVATGNFNGDTKTDLAVANYYSNTISVLLGNGDGTFQDAVSYEAGNNPSSVFAADFDNDGDTDLVFVNDYLAGISIMAGHGDGTFGAPVTQAAGLQPGKAAIGDFDQDGNRDVVVSDYYYGAISVLLGNGNGTLRPAVRYDFLASSFIDPAGIVIGDFDGNGTSDVVVGASNTLYLFLGNGDGTLQAPTTTSAGFSMEGLTSGDFEQDGKIDLAAVSYYDGAAILKGNGNGTFAAPVEYAMGYGVSMILSEDINGDGKVDLLGASTSWNSLSLLLGNGDGTFQDVIQESIYAEPRQLVTGDFNADGRVDLAMPDYYGSGVAVMLGGCADLAITKTHQGNLVTGQSAMYEIEVTNIGAGSVHGVVTVTDLLPAGLQATQIYGYPWTCNQTTLVCTTDAPLSPGYSYDVIRVYVNVSSNAGASIVNTATVSSIGDSNAANNTASDTATVTLVRDLTVTKTHIGTFAQGQTGRTYTIVVKNSGGAATSGTVSVVDYVPYGLTAVEMSGAGWNCDVGLRTCTRNDSLAGGASYPPVLFTVNVNNNSSAWVTNTAYVWGGGETGNEYNNYADDGTAILTTPANVVATTVSPSQILITWQSVAYATVYEVQRSSHNGPFEFHGYAAGPIWWDGTVSPNTTYLYRVRAIADTTIGGFSNVDLATTILFTDDPLVAGVTKVKSVHFTELRTAVNAVRVAAGLTPDILAAVPFSSGSTVQASHLTILRWGLDEARSALGLLPNSYSDPTIVGGSTIKAAHVRELRSGVK